MCRDTSPRKHIMHNILPPFSCGGSILDEFAAVFKDSESSNVRETEVGLRETMNYWVDFDDGNVDAGIVE